MKKRKRKKHIPSNFHTIPENNTRKKSSIMTFPNNANFKHDKMIYGATTTPRQSGGKYAKVGYGTIETQVHF